MDTKSLISQRGLRPVGNKKRLLYTEGEVCNASMQLFRDKAHAERYYSAFIDYARKNPPPFVIEAMVARTSQIVFKGVYAFICPYFGTSASRDYYQWASEAIPTCNEIVRPDNYYADEYERILPRLKAVLLWDILVPRDFIANSPEAQELLNDSSDKGFDPVPVETAGE